MISKLEILTQAIEILFNSNVLNVKRGIRITGKVSRERRTI